MYYLIRLGLGLVVLAFSPSALQAQGLFLKITCDQKQVAVGRPLRIAITAVATRAFTVPSTPTVLIDRGEGLKADLETQCRLAESPTIRFSSDHAFRG